MIASAVALALLASPVAPPRKQAPRIHWAASYEQALNEAEERGVALMIAIIQDGEEANEDVLENTILHKSFVEKTQHTVNLISNRGSDQDHGNRPEQRKGRTVHVCGRFGSHACLSHRKIQVDVYRDFAEDGVLRNPTVLLALPDQTVVARLIDRNPLGAYLAAFDKAAASLPNGLTLEEAEQLKAELAQAEDDLAQGNVGKILAFAKPYADQPSASTLVQRAASLIERVEELGRVELEAIERKVAARNYAPAIDGLTALQKQYAGTQVAKVARERCAKLKRNKEVKAALKRAKREETAKNLLERADGLASSGQEDRAQALYDRLLEKFADTEAASEYRNRS